MFGLQESVLLRKAMSKTALERAQEEMPKISSLYGTKLCSLLPIREEIIIFEFIGSEQKQRTYIWRNNLTSESQRVYELAYLGNNVNLVHLSALVGMTILERLGLKTGIGLAHHGLNFNRSGIIPSRPDKIFPHSLIEHGTS